MQYKRVNRKRVRGSNQYVSKYAIRKAEKQIKSLFVSVVILGLLGYAGHVNLVRYLESHITIVSPLPQEAKAAEVPHITTSPLPTKQPTPTIYIQKNPIEDAIREVFGKDADKALTLLSCENKSLNPNAVNTVGNYPAGSRDIGVFQINEYWQNVNARYLFNPDINIRIAHQIYSESGNSFRMWSCGKKLGI